MENQKIKKPVYAGSFYPEDAETLQFMIKQFLDAADIKLKRCKPKVLVVPHAGYVYSGYTAGYSYKLLKDYASNFGGKLKIFLIGPCHSMVVKNFVLSSYNLWHTPLGEVRVSELNNQLASKEEFSVFDQVFTKEHCLEVQLPFLQVALRGTNFEIIPILCSKLKTESMIDAFEEQLDENSVIVISTDLSHYLSQDQANSVDEQTIEALRSKDDEKLQEVGDACGLCGLRLAINLANRNKWKAKIADYSTSAETVGSKDAVVGYLSAYFCK
jgi:hypothetical protein